jgi:WhiB family redox-sensing transcriptional regulator
MTGRHNQLLRAQDGPQEWMDDAACRDIDPGLFWPGRGQNIAPATAICNACPVQAQCLDYGLGEREGIWGGRSAAQRRRIRRQQQQHRRKVA